MSLLKTILVLCAVIVLLVVMYYFLMLQGVKFERKYVEVQRVSSPDGKVDFVVCESDAGAMSNTVLSVYVVEAKKQIAQKEQPVFEADYVDKREIVWISDKLLEIKYEKAKIFRFRNYIYPLEDEPSRIVEIREVLLSPSALRGN
jgi:hypothetical protein